MWLTLIPGETRRLATTHRQAIWPASELSSAELVITTRAELEERVLIATPQVTRLRYTILGIECSFSLDGSAPVPWPEARAVRDQSFEIMLTSRGALIVNPERPRLPNRLEAWLLTVAEDVRAAWPPLPPELKGGESWSSPPLVPGGLPPGTSSVTVTVNCEAGFVSSDSADVTVRFDLRAQLEDNDAHATTAIGEGSMNIHLSRQAGPTVATRSSATTLVGPGRRDQVVRTSAELIRPREPETRTDGPGEKRVPALLAMDRTPTAVGQRPAPLGTEKTPRVLPGELTPTASRGRSPPLSGSGSASQGEAPLPAVLDDEKTPA